MSGRANTVLVVAAHPDDEVLGCGGTVARHAAQGDRCYSLILAEGGTARAPGGEESGMREEVTALQGAAHAAAQALGAEAPRFAGFPDNRLDTVARLEVVQAVEGAVRALGPTIVYTHHGGDLNIDHRIAHEAVLTACRPTPGHTVHRIYAFETVSSTEWGVSGALAPFMPTRYVDVAAALERKLSALSSYEKEMRGFPHARSHENVMALARHRGASVGLEAAEAFVVLREIVPSVQGQT